MQYRSTAILGFALLAGASASAQPPKVWAVLAPKATIAPDAPPSGQPCEGDSCTLKALQNAWRRGVLKHEQPKGMNADSIIADRTSFAEGIERYRDKPPVFNYDILGSGVCITGLVLHTC